MSSVGTSFATTLQDVQRLAKGMAFGGSLDELIRCIPFFLLEGSGESIEVPRVTASLAGVSAWRAVGATPAQTAPTAASHTFNFRRLDSLSADDDTLIQANTTPNSVAVADNIARRTSILRNLAAAIIEGQDDDLTGFDGWENFVNNTNRTDVAFIGISAAQTLETLLVADDTCTCGELGNRASAYVTNAQGRRNIEVAAQTLGLELDYSCVSGIENEVPYFRGRPIIVSSGIATVSDQAPLWAVDFNYVFMVATTGHPDDYCIATRSMTTQESGLGGELQWFHGACVVRQPSALVRALITTTLSS